MPRRSLACLMDRLSEAFNEYLKASTVTNPNSCPPPHLHPPNTIIFPFILNANNVESSTTKWQSFVGDELDFILFILYLFIFNLMSFFDFQVLYFIAARLLIKVEPHGFDWIRF